MITINYALTVKDIQPKHVRCESNPNNQNKIRCAWVNALSENAVQIIQDKIKSSDARFAYYDSVDRDVSQKWIEIMRNHYQESIKSGAKIVMTSCGERLEDDFCVDADEQLIQAAIMVAETIAAEMNK